MRRPFDYIPITSELGRTLASLGAEFINDPQIRVLREGANGSCYQLIADAKLRVKRNGRVELRRYYCSLQQRRPKHPRFRARTLQYYSATGEHSWHNFPDDPYLAPMAAALADNGEADVLSYVPLRRATFLRHGPDGDVVIKFKRPDRFEEAAQLQAQVQAEIVALNNGAPMPFQVAKLLELDQTNQKFIQQSLPGSNLASLVTLNDAAAWMTQVGAIHAALHRLPSSDWPTEPADAERELLNNFAWLTLVAPDQSSELATCIRLLAEEPAPPTRPCFCHGDFVCSQLLVDQDRWGVVDFDRCYSGDRHRDLAIFMASLGYDVPALVSGIASCRVDGDTLRQLRTCYLESYYAHSDVPIDRHRLTWQLAQAELHYLALMVKKNRFQPRVFNIALASLAHTCRELDG